MHKIKFHSRMQGAFNLYYGEKNIPAGYTRAILTSQETGCSGYCGQCEITFTAEGIPTLKTLTNSNVTEVSGTDNRKWLPLILQLRCSSRTWNSTIPCQYISGTEYFSSRGDNRATLNIKTFRGDDGKGVMAERGVRLLCYSRYR